MSITVIELITDALQEVNVIDANQAPSAEQGVKTLRRLNQMMMQWQLDGIRLGYYPQTDMDATVPIDISDELGVTLNLAVSIAPSYGIEIIESLRMQATTYYDALAKQALQYFESDMTQLPMSDFGPYVYNGFIGNGV
jgi:hypothetical protein